MSTSSVPAIPYSAARPMQAATGHSGAPPSAACLIARTPQVGARAHEIGLTQSGKSESGTRNPQTSQTGYSSAFPSAQAVR